MCLGRPFRFGAVCQRLADNPVHEGFAAESFRARMQVTDFPGGISAMREFGEDRGCSTS